MPFWDEKSKWTKVLRMVTVGYIALIIIASVFSGLFNLFFRDNLGFIGNSGWRGNSYQDAGY